jgi:hypothetical protein
MPSGSEYDVNEEVQREACGKLSLKVLFMYEFFLVVHHICLLQFHTINCQLNVAQCTEHTEF